MTDIIHTVSIGVGHDSTSINDYDKQEIINDEYKYLGNIHDGKKHGHGILSWSDGRMYKGDFFDDKRHGFGIFYIPNISEFKGLYCDDERFGPGILIYKSLNTADVGLWLNEDLIRLLYSHSKLSFDISITDKKSRNFSLFNSNLNLKKNCSNFFCNYFSNENTFSNQYNLKHINQIEHLNNEKLISNILSPNQTYEQQQLYYHINQFWSFKQRASFSIDDIISNNRSSFPDPGPLEKASLNLFQYSFYGQIKDVRNILFQRLVYVDVCDSHGLTALHFATYNIHIDVVNILLDFGANVNQLSDDDLTPLTIAFILYYGNNKDETNNIALEHIDPIIKNPRILCSIETNNNNNKLLKEKFSNINNEIKTPLIEINNFEKKNSYGYELTTNLREHIRNEQYRESIYSLIILLLRRGADPSLSDWPLPILALAVRADDKQMVELLLKYNVQINCQLNSNRHANLTPLHIACGCLSSNAIYIAKLLLEHGAHIDAQSSLGNNEYFSLIDPIILNTNKFNNIQQGGRTPLHIACTREATLDTLNLVRLLLEYDANPNIVCNGQTPLTLAIALGNESLVDLLLNYNKTDPSIILGLGNGNALCTLLSTFYEPYWSYTKRLQLIERLIAKNPKVLYPIRFGPKNTFGSSVDFAYYMFYADSRISQTPYHSLTNQERIIFTERKDLLAYIAKRFREEVSKYEEFLRLPTPTLDSHTQTPSPTNLYSQYSNSHTSSFMTDTTDNYCLKITGEFRYCATCGRSTGVRLTHCKRCQKVSFCSKACHITGWNTFHRYQCRHLSNIFNPSEKQITKTKTKLPSIHSNSNRTDYSSLQNVQICFENSTDLNHVLFKDNLLSIKTSPKTNNNRLPPLSVSKLLRQKRKKSPKNISNTLEHNQLSFNSNHSGLENYSFN